MATSYADRGKSLEANFKKQCQALQSLAAFAFYRFPDAHSGSLQTVPADYQTCWAGKLRLIELKETATVGRLPYKNLGADQNARLRLWGLAGAESFILIRETKTEQYLVFAPEAFLDRSQGASWFFKEMQPLFTSSDLKSAFNFIHQIP